MLGKPKTRKTKIREVEKIKASDTYKQYKHLANIKHILTPSQIITKPHSIYLPKFQLPNKSCKFSTEITLYAKKKEKLHSKETKQA